MPSPIDLSLFSKTAKPANLCWLVWALHLCSVAFGLYHHAVWADEADPWNLASDANWQDFWNFFGHSGHPPLWHILLWPLARTGLPVGAMLVLHGALSATIGWLLLFRSPFALWFCALLLFSQCLGFQYAVISRGYALMTVLAFLLVLAHPTRLQHPLRYGALLAMLFNSETLFIAPVALLATCFTLEGLKQRNPAHLMAVAMAGAGACLSLYLLWPPADMKDFYATNHDYPGRFFTNLRTGLWSIATRPAGKVLESVAQHLAGLNFPLYLSLALLAAIAATVRKSRSLAMFACGIAWLYYVFEHLYLGYFWHGQIILILALTSLWLHHIITQNAHTSQALQTALAWLFIAPLGFGVYANISSHRLNIDPGYSGSKAMAAFIAQNGYADKVITATACYEFASVAAYLPDTRFWLVGQQLFSRHNHQGVQIECMNNQNNRYTPALQQQNQTEDLLLLASGKMQFPDAIPAQELFFVPGFKESFALYRVPKLQK